MPAFVHASWQAFRGRQADPQFQWGPAGDKPLSLADIIVAGAVVVVQQCSGGALRIPHTLGRPEATLADNATLPSPASLIDDKHFSVFQQMVRLMGAPALAQLVFYSLLTCKTVMTDTYGACQHQQLPTSHVAYQRGVPHRPTTCSSSLGEIQMCTPAH